MLLGSHLLKSWSSTQQTVTLSSGEAEYDGVVKGTSVGLGMVAMLKDVGVLSALKVRTDSAAAQGVGGRQGLGKLRHIDTTCLWIQDKIRRGVFVLSRIKGILNPADIFTKYTHTADQVQKCVDWMGCTYETGRAISAPFLRHGLSSVASKPSGNEEANCVEAIQHKRKQNLNYLMPVLFRKLKYYREIIQPHFLT